MLIKSFAFIGFSDTGQKIVESGFSNFNFLADGVCDGTQKLGKLFLLSFDILEIVDTLLVEAPTTKKNTELESHKVIESQSKLLTG